MVDFPINFMERFEKQLENIQEENRNFHKELGEKIKKVEENKNLKVENKSLGEKIKKLIVENKTLGEKIKKLENDNKRLEGENKLLWENVEKLENENKFLVQKSEDEQKNSDRKITCLEKIIEYLRSDDNKFAHEQKKILEQDASLSKSNYELLFDYMKRFQYELYDNMEKSYKLEWQQASLYNKIETLKRNLEREEERSKEFHHFSLSLIKKQ